MSLRDEAITHMAEVIQRSAFNTEGGDDPAFGLSWAADTLDALLDFLDAHTEEWDEAVPSAIGVSVKPFGLDKAIRFLVVALRGTT